MWWVDQDIIANNSLVLDGRLLEQPKWGYSRRWSGMERACHGVVAQCNRSNLVAVARTWDRLGVEDSRATSAVGEGTESIDRREEDR